MSIDIERLAREAGFDIPLFDITGGLVFEAERKHMERFAALVLEQAAREVDHLSLQVFAEWKRTRQPVDHWRCDAMEQCADAIRSMKPKDAA